ncbi:MAG: sulfite exporter TauE/SafE family protein [Burkholderiales bacterium]|nr:sulfite exporter TauE/SafE family protein [Burkholderiales bacterium]
MEWWLGYAAIGAAVGFFAGLLGIGGGAIMVPLLVMLLEAQGLPKSQIMHLAVGTGMASILFTSVSSVRAHALRGAVRWDLALALTPGILVGGLLGSNLTVWISTQLFAALFTVVVFFAASNILIDRKPKPTRELPGALGSALVGFGISFVSSLAALGGAFLTVPFALYCNVPMLQAIGTSAIVGFPIALAGSVGFVMAGWGHGDLPPYSIGYVYLPAVFGIAFASVLTAPLGAAAAHRLPTKRLKQVFALLLYTLATKMLFSLW